MSPSRESIEHLVKSMMYRVDVLPLAEHTSVRRRSEEGHLCLSCGAPACHALPVNVGGQDPHTRWLDVCLLCAALVHVVMTDAGNTFLADPAEGGA